MRRPARGAAAALVVSLSVTSARADDPPVSGDALLGGADPRAAVPPASAEAGVDRVDLADGTSLEGRITEMVPRDHITIVTVTGETRRVRWFDARRVVVVSTFAPGGPWPAAEPPPAPVTADEELAPINDPGPKARVHLRGDNRLYRFSGGTWSLACVSPCDRDLPLAGPYQLRSGIRKTGEFDLEAQPEGKALELEVRGTNALGLVPATLLGIVGGPLLYVGGLQLYVGLLEKGSGSSFSGKKDVEQGLVVGGIGAAFSAGSILLFVLSTRTTLGTSTVPATRAPKDAFLRMPVWREPGNPLVDAPPGLSWSRSF